MNVHKLPKRKSKPGCPICSQAVETRYRPFCSSRCADTDLDRWLGGVYSIPVVDLDEGDLEQLDRALSDAQPDAGEGNDLL